MQWMCYREVKSVLPSGIHGGAVLLALGYLWGEMVLQEYGIETGVLPRMHKFGCYVSMITLLVFEIIKIKPKDLDG